MRIILIIVLFASFTGCVSQKSDSTESKDKREANKPVSLVSDLKIVIVKKLGSAPEDTFISESPAQDKMPLLAWLGGKDKIDRILIETPHINVKQQRFSKQYVLERIEKSVCLKSQTDKWHYAPYARGTICMKNGTKINFTMYLSGIKIGKMLFVP